MSKKGRDSTISLDVGEERPAPGVANLYGKREPIPKGIRYCLKVEAGPVAPATYDLTQSLTILGRGEQLADLDIGDDSASRRHACIEFKEGGFWLVDMGSMNGTILNGKMVSKERLADGDEIQIGTAVIRFERR